MLGEIAMTGFVWISGHTQLYNDQVQIILEQIRAVEVSQEEIVKLLPSTNKNIDEMFDELKRR